MHFTLSDSNLLSSEIFDAENPSDDNTDGVYNICIRSTDNTGLTYDENFVIDLNDIDDTNPIITLVGTTPINIEL